MIRHQQETSSSELEANLQRHTGTSPTQTKDNYLTDMEDLYPAIGKKTMTTNELERYPL
jgi:hypothetical protein